MALCNSSATYHLYLWLEGTKHGAFVLKNIKDCVLLDREKRYLLLVTGLYFSLCSSRRLPSTTTFKALVSLDLMGEFF